MTKRKEIKLQQKENNLQKTSGLTAFAVVARANGINIDLRQVEREFSFSENKFTTTDLIYVIKKHDFKAQLKTLRLEAFKKYPLPSIFLTKDGLYGVILKIDFENKNLFVFYENKPVKMSFEEFENLSSANFDKAEGGLCQAERRLSEGRMPERSKFKTKQYIVISQRLFTENIKFGFRWFLAEILKFKQVIAEVMLGSFTIQIFALITPLFTQVILDKVIVHRTITTLNVLAFAFVAVMIFEFLLNLARKYIFIHTASKIDAKLGVKLFHHLFALPFNYFENRKVGNIIARVRELDTIREFITNKMISVVIDVLFSFVFVIMMFIYSPQLTFATLGFVSVIAVLYIVVTPEYRRRLEEKFQMGAKSNSYLVETTTGVQTVKSLAIEGSMQKKWDDVLADYVRSNFNLANISNIFGALSGLLQKGMTITILYLGVKLVIQNQLTVGQLIAFQMFANQFTSPILRLVNLWNELQQALLGVDRLSDILNHPVESQSSKSITLPKLDGNIRIEGLKFSYSSDTPLVINDLSLNIKAGTSIAFVGRSGSGKSTVAKLLQRLYLPLGGAIYLDDVDVRHLNPLWLRYNIGVVLQENYLFSGTIKENITLSKPDAPIEAVIQSCKIAGAHEFISQFPEGYETMVGERGSTLSGGQRQRIAIARALITNPKILIFDEATSALDYESERIIQENIEKIKQGRTVIIIAHRLSSIRTCDTIVALDKGNIIEQGSHDELLKQKGFYYSLNKSQKITSS